jgi:hypothetical protein
MPGGMGMGIEMNAPSGPVARALTFMAGPFPALTVMAGRVPAIHASTAGAQMAGTCPAMTQGALAITRGTHRLLATTRRDFAP